MSKRNNKASEKNVAEEKKIQTSYDRKIERRRIEAEKAKKEKIRNRIIGVCVLVVLVAFIASFPIKNVMKFNETFVTINGEAVSQGEFDYNRALAKANFLNQNSQYFSMFGLDVSIIETQMYTDQLSFADYFDQLAIEQIIDTRCLRDEARKEGFQYDTNQEYMQTVSNIKEMAAEQNMSVKKYYQMIYGTYASEKNLRDIMNENLYAVAYCEKVEEEKTPSDADVLAYYEANKASYDSVDYHMTTVEAELPTTAPDGTVEKDEEGNEIPYQPTDEEINTAMEAAKAKAEEARATVAKDGKEYKNQSAQSGYIHNLLNDFLFAETTKPGDTYVAENTSFNNYVVGSFEGRRRDDSPTQNARIIITSEISSQTIMDEWKNGDATEDRFIELYYKYDEANSVEDGLFEGLTPAVLDEEIASWITSKDRKTGDIFAKDVEGDANYFIYYMGENDPEWKISIRNTMLSEAMSEYVEALTENYVVEDPEGKLKYLIVEKETEEAEAAE